MTTELPSSMSAVEREDAEASYLVDMMRWCEQKEILHTNTNMDKPWCPCISPVLSRSIL